MEGRVSKVAEYAVKNPSAIREILTLVIDYHEYPEKYLKKLIYLGGGWPQDPPPPALRECLLSLAEDEGRFNEASKYGLTVGQPRFIKGVVNYEGCVFGRSVEEGEVMVGSGSTELTAAFISAILDPGDEVILTKPFYLNHLRQVQMETCLQAKVKEWPIIEGGFFNPSLDKLQSLVTERTKLIILTTPGNPDSSVFKDDLLNGVVDVGEDKGLWVLIDVSYRAYHFKEIPRYYARRRRENEIWICSFSKEFRVPGWRLAYAIADPDLINSVNTIEQARTLCPSRLAQEVFIPILMDRRRLQELKEFYREGASRYSSIAKLTVEALKDNIPKLKLLEPQGGFYIFFNHEAYEKSSKKLCKELLERECVALTPGLDFGLEGWTRLSFAPSVLNPEVILEGIVRMKKYFETLTA